MKVEHDRRERHHEDDGREVRRSGPIGMPASCVTINVAALESPQATKVPSSAQADRKMTSNTIPKTAMAAMEDAQILREVPRDQFRHVWYPGDCHPEPRAVVAALQSFEPGRDRDADGVRSATESSVDFSFGADQGGSSGLLRTSSTLYGPRAQRLDAGHVRQRREFVSERRDPRGVRRGPDVPLAARMISGDSGNSRWIALSVATWGSLSEKKMSATFGFRFTMWTKIAASAAKITASRSAPPAESPPRRDEW